MNKIFEHVTVDPTEDLNTEYINGKRHYILPNGKRLPSITTVLDHFKGPELQAWKDRVGEDKAQKIARKAATKGSALHSTLERYLNNDPTYLDGVMPNTKQAFVNIRECVNRINRIRHQECVLYSEHLGVAGRTDVIAEYDGVLAVIDFKTSRRQKKEEWILSYFEQATAYAIMYEETFGVSIERIVIVIISDERYPQVFIKNKSDYESSLKEKIATYYKEHNLCF